MPLYEYRCPNCGYEFDSITTVNSRLKATCARCGVVAKLRVSLSNFKMAVPLYLLDSKGKILNSNPNSSSSRERNPDIPPDYPNLLEV